MRQLTPILRSAAGSRASWTLALVAAVYGLVQLILFDSTRFLEWDEAVYLAEITSDVPSVGFRAHRARGITLLAAPPALLGAGLSTIRLYFVGLSTVALFASFSAWLHRGWVATIGAALFASTWLALFYGSEISPNLYVSYIAVAVVGLVARGNARSRNAVSIMFLLGLAAALLRPVDAVVIGAVSLVFAVLAGAVEWRLIIGLAVGILIGLLEWMIEALVIWGGIEERIGRVAEIIPSGFGWMGREYAALADGPTVGPDTSHHVAWLALASIGVWLIIVVFYARRDWRQSMPFLVSAALLASPYLLVVKSLAPRFLLPALAVMTIAVGVAIEKRRAASSAWLLLVLAVAALPQFQIANQVEADHYAAREATQAVAELIRSLKDGRTCQVASQFGYPQIAFGSGCDGNQLDLASPELARHGRDEETAFFVVVVSEPQTETVLRAWQSHRVEGFDPWTVYAPPPG